MQGEEWCADWLQSFCAAFRAFAPPSAPGSCFDDDLLNLKASSTQVRPRGIRPIAVLVVIILHIPFWGRSIALRCIFLVCACIRIDAHPFNARRESVCPPQTRPPSLSSLIRGEGGECTQILRRCRMARALARTRRGLHPRRLRDRVDRCRRTTPSRSAQQRPPTRASTRAPLRLRLTCGNLCTHPLRAYCQASPVPRYRTRPVSEEGAFQRVPSERTPALPPRRRRSTGTTPWRPSPPVCRPAGSRC
jgi:hypothetical protein